MIPNGASIPLGPFDLHAIIGQGGMAEVWRGVHRVERAPVAVKVLTAALGRTSLFERAFRREVQAVAGLDHPNIVMVLDYGLIPAEGEVASGGRLTSGSPYLVMELATGGTLRRALKVGDRTWGAIKGVLLSLLDALAHAHARGVVHRDIKPGNVLWFGEGEAPGWKLTDFGVARAASQASTKSLELAAGTPLYMAPEQIQGRWRDQGPWSDLYGLGCLGWEMVTGQAPFHGHSSMEVLEQHLGAPLPRMVSSFQTPPGFEGWLARLLQKRPEDRFQRAADAAWALLALGDPPQIEQAPARPWANPGQHQTRPMMDPDVNPTRQLDDGGDAVPTEPLGEVPQGTDGVFVALESPSTPRPGPMERPPVPQTWRRLRRPPRPQALQGAGLGLFGLRALPLVGREEIQDRLWGALGEVIERRRASVVMLRGAAGVGKSRLARWLCERAHEAGTAEVMVAPYGPSGGDDGLAQLLRQHMVCAELDREELIERTQRWLQRHGNGSADPWDLVALVELMSGQEAGQTHHGGDGRSGPVCRVIEQTAARRPVVVWIDDLQWGGEAMAMLSLLKERQGHLPRPVLVVATVQNEALEELPAVAPRLETLLGGWGSSLEVTPLATDAVETMVQRLLPLEAALAAQVAARSGGVPLFVVQIVDDWVQRGALEPGQGGFRLKAGVEVGLPPTLHRAWRTRVARLLEGRTGHDRVALELAAVLGARVRTPEWREACSRSLLRPSRDLVDAMVDRRLAVWTEGGWAFVHGMLRESLLQSARDTERLIAHHRTCAEALKRLYPGRRQINERLARHLQGAGLLEEAIEAMTAAIEARLGRGELAEADALLDQRRDMLDALAAPAGDPRRGVGWALRTHSARMQGRLEEAAQWGERLETAALEHGWVEPRARGQLERAMVANQRGQLDEARRLFGQAVATFEAVGSDVGMAEGMLGLGGVAYRQGDRRRARACFLEALTHFEEKREDNGIARTLRGLAELSLLEAHWDRAQDLFQRAMAIHQRLGNRFMWVSCLNGVAELHRHQGDHDGAEARYLEAMELLEKMGSQEIHVLRINLGFLDIARGRHARARLRLEPLVQQLEAVGQHWLLGGVHAALLACAAAEGDWEAWDHHHQRADALLTASGSADPDDAAMIHEAADRAREAGQRDRARAAYALALALWDQLGQRARARQAQAGLRA